MFTKNIKWSNGQKLDRDVLSLSDELIIRHSELSNLLPFNLSKGIVAFELDNDSLNTGLIMVQKLTAYLEDKRFISFDNSYPLTLQLSDSGELADIIPIYLNINERVVEHNQIKCVTEILSLSTEYDHTAIHSTVIASFRMNNAALEIEECDFPILSMNHYLMEPILLKLNKLISNLENFNKFVFSSSHPYMSTYLNFLLLKFKRELNFAEFNKNNVSPYNIFNSVHDIYSLLISANIEKDENMPTVFRYEFEKAYSKFNNLIDQIEIICKQRNIKNFVQFHRQGQKYICDNLPQEFFTANKYYFVAKKKPGVELTNKLSREIKITSISRYTNSVVLSLPGLRLKEIERSMHRNLHISLGDDDLLFEIESNSEWDFVLVDKSATFTAFDQYENYDFFIAFL
jgi:predicted component of type VI protein secretion system